MILTWESDSPWVSWCLCFCCHWVKSLALWGGFLVTLGSLTTDLPRYNGGDMKSGRDSSSSVWDLSVVDLASLACILSMSWDGMWSTSWESMWLVTSECECSPSWGGMWTVSCVGSVSWECRWSMSLGAWWLLSCDWLSLSREWLWLVIRGESCLSRGEILCWSGDPPLMTSGEVLPRWPPW